MARQHLGGAGSLKLLTPAITLRNSIGRVAYNARQVSSFIDGDGGGNSLSRSVAGWCITTLIPIAAC